MKPHSIAFNTTESHAALDDTRRKSTLLIPCKPVPCRALIRQRVSCKHDDGHDCCAGRRGLNVFVHEIQLHAFLTRELDWKMEEGLLQQRPQAIGVEVRDVSRYHISAEE